MEWISRISSELPEAPIAVPRAIWQVLHTRGIRTATDIENHFSPKLKDLSHPFSIDEMDKAVERLIRAFKSQEKIAIYGDYDLDGTPGISLLKSGLEALGFKNVITDQPLRLLDGYGVHPHRVAKLHERGVTLIVTVDVGITDVAGVDAAISYGIDVIVTDHHLPKEELPKALAIVNPNKSDCGSQLGHLCGTGVAFYLLLALRMELKKQGLGNEEFNPKDLLDLFAIATITDMVPLIKENRILVKHGLKALGQTRRPGLRALLQNLKLYGKELDAFDVGFKIAPKLNALSRLEEGLRPLDVFLASEEDAARVVENMFTINDRRQQLQKAAMSEALELMTKNSSSDFIWVFSENFHPGVVSLVANGLMQKFKVPAFVGAVRTDGRISGSARAPGDRGLNLQNVFDKASQALHKYGGHAMAAGFETHLELAMSLRDQLAEYFLADSAAHAGHGEGDPEEGGGKAPRSATLNYDGELALNEFTPQFMSYYEAMGPYGQGFQAPVFLMKHLLVKKVKALKNNKFKYHLTSVLNDRVIEAPWFESPQEFAEGTRVNMLFEPQWNTYLGQKTLQAIIKDMRAI
jgi:single-stranded-DNA-specific exonuclease